MVDHARLTFRPRGLAVRAGIGGAIGRKAERQVEAAADQLDRSPRPRAMTAALMADTSGPAQELKRVYRRRSLADLEVKLRRTHLARLARFRNHLATLDGVPALHHQLTRMGICGNIAVG